MCPRIFYCEKRLNWFKEILRECFNSEVEAKSSEVLKETQATISCVVKGLTRQLDTVKWEKPGDVAITNGQDGYVIDVGSYKSNTKSQTTILTIPAAENTADKVYTCVITSNEHAVITQKTGVNSNVFSELKKVEKWYYA